MNRSRLGNIILLVIMVSCAFSLQAQDVFITEIMTANDDTRCIETDKTYDPDWIEFYNMTDQPIDLKGWYLSDDTTLPTRWQFPESFVIPQKGYRILFTTGKSEVGAYDRPNFRLSYCGETITLRRNDRQIEDRLSFPPLDPGTSYGRVPDNFAKTQVFDTPTPGLGNDQTPSKSNCDMPRPPPTRLACIE